MEKLTLIKIKNPFDRADQDVVATEYRGESLLAIRDANIPKGMEVAISINGTLIETTDDRRPMTDEKQLTTAVCGRPSAVDLSKVFPQAGDHILFMPKIEGGGGDGNKNVLRIILLIVIAIVAPFVAPALGIAAAGTTGAMIVAGIVMIVGGLLVNALLPPPKPKMPTLDNSAFDTSYTYGWAPQTVQQQGLVLPRFYGLNRLYGNIIAAYVETIDNKQYLNALIDLGLGPVSRLYDFKINDQPYENFQNVCIETRYGYLDQEPISNFEKTKNEYTMSVKVLKDFPYTYATIGDDFNGLEIEVTFPNGLYYANDQGGLDPYGVDVRVEARKSGDTEWYCLTHQTIAWQVQAFGGKWSAGYWGVTESEYGGGGRPVWVELKVGDTNPNSHREGDSYTFRPGGRDSDWVEGFWHWIVVPYMETETAYVDYLTIGGSQAAPVRRTFFINDILKPGKYEIRVTNLTADQTSSRYGDDLYLASIREVYYDLFEYPRHVLVGIKALANDQLSGSLRFSCLAESALIRVYDDATATWSVEYDNNPAWVCFDILTQPVYDSDLNVLRYDGMDPSRLITADFTAWADFCDVLCPDGAGGTEKRITFNGGFDTEASMWDAAIQVCQVGRAILVWRGVKLAVVADMPAEPVQLFTVGNIAKGSFKETFLPIEDRAAEIEIDFLNAELDFQRDKLTVFNKDIASTVNKVTMQLFGVTKASEAWRAGQYRLANNQYVLRSMEKEADIDSIACTLGDVINVQHDVPQWGEGGRVVSATDTTVTLDKTITIAGGKSYGILIRLGSDAMTERTVTDGAGSYTTLHVSSPFDPVPEQFDVYAFGEIGKLVKPFRVMNIRRRQDNQKAMLMLAEYNANIYLKDLDSPEVPTIDYASLDVLPDVENLRLDELILRGADGAINDVIDVYFDRPDNAAYAAADIWHTKGADWIFAGNTIAESFRINNVEINATYTVAVVTVNALGQKQALSLAPYASLYTLGKLDTPSNVTLFWAKQNGATIDFTWTHIPDMDMWGYEIRQGTNWESARILTTGIQHDHYSIPAEINGTFRWLIKAIDDSMLYSQTAASADLTVTGVDEQLNIVLTQDEMTKTPVPADGVKTDLIYVPLHHALMFLGGMTDSDIPDKSDDWATIAGLSDTAYVIGSYVTSAIDLGKIDQAWIRLLAVIDAVDTGATDNSYPTRTDNDFPFDTDGHITMPVTYTLAYSLSDDDIAYGAYQPYTAAVQETFRYLKVKLDVNMASITGRLKITSLIITLDVPDRIETMLDVAIAAVTGSDIAFSSAFYAAPFVRVFLKSSATNKVPSLSGVTAAGCHVDLIDPASAKVAGTVDLEAVGY